MPQVGFEPTIPMFEQAKTVHVLERAVTVIGSEHIWLGRNSGMRQVSRNFNFLEPK
jgi:hypothetical protein